MENRIKEQQLGAVRRPHLDRAIAVESDPILFFIDRVLFAGDAAAAGVGGDENGAGASRDDPSTLVEDRGADPDHGAQGGGFRWRPDTPGRGCSSKCMPISHGGNRSAAENGAATSSITASRQASTGAAIEVSAKSDRKCLGNGSQTEHRSVSASRRHYGEALPPQNHENLIPRAPPTPFPRIGEKCGLVVVLACSPLQGDLVNRTFLLGYRGGHFHWATEGDISIGLRQKFA